MEDQIVQVGKYKIKVLRGQCISATTCVAVAPGTFSMDTEGKAVVNPASAEAEASIMMAAQSCPTKAIVIMDAETGAQIWPTV